MYSNLDAVWTKSQPILRQSDHMQTLFLRLNQLPRLPVVQRTSLGRTLYYMSAGSIPRQRKDAVLFRRTGAYFHTRSKYLRGN